MSDPARCLHGNGPECRKCERIEQQMERAGVMVAEEPSSPGPSDIAAAVPVPDAGDDTLREPNPNDAIQSLARITAAASRLMAQMHRLGQTRDPDDEITHMRANLDHVDAQVQSWWRGGQS